jgi:hypothetical protein
MSSPYEPARDSNNPGFGGGVWGHTPNSALPQGGGQLAEQDYRDPDEKGGPGRADFTAPASAGAQPADKPNMAPVAGHPGAGHGGK